MGEQIVVGFDHSYKTFLLFELFIKIQYTFCFVGLLPFSLFVELMTSEKISLDPLELGLLSRQ